MVWYGMVRYDTIRYKKNDHRIHAYLPINLNPMAIALLTTSTHSSPLSLCVPSPIHEKVARGTSESNDDIWFSFSSNRAFSCVQIGVLLDAQKGQEEEEDDVGGEEEKGSTESPKCSTESSSIEVNVEPPSPP